MAFLLDLNQIRGTRERVERTFPGSAFDTPEEDFSVASDIVFVADVEKDGARVRIAGRVQASLELRCSRCLEPMAWPVDASFDLRYLPAAENTAQDEHEVAAEDLGVGFYEGNAIDLAQLVREQFYLAIPMKPLCRTDCQGLCPECGGNLNVTRCGCEHRWVDPRMAALGQLLPKSPKEH